jgi:hypothetical protein
LPFFGQLNEDEIKNAFLQQAETTAHTVRWSTELLEGVFGERLISRGIWPPRSPDLSPPDFLWGAATSQVYENNPKSIAELKTAIKCYVQFITAEKLCSVLDKVKGDMCVTKTVNSTSSTACKHSICSVCTHNVKCLPIK